MKNEVELNLLTKALEPSGENISSSVSEEFLFARNLLRRISCLWRAFAGLRVHVVLKITPSSKIKQSLKLKIAFVVKFIWMAFWRISDP